jgi:hypothetical protein
MAKLAALSKELAKMERTKSYLENSDELAHYQMIAQQVEDLERELYNDDIPF